MLSHFFQENENILEVGVDEVGRGPLFGRVYTAAVVLPRNTDFDFSLMKDSKKFTSSKKINLVAEYIKTHALSYSVQYEDEKKIDQVNILQATQLAMRSAINAVVATNPDSKHLLLIDGNYFKALPLRPVIDNEGNVEFTKEDHVCVVGGDAKYCSIAAASILAKVSRDEYIRELCNADSTLDEKYGIQSNKGYGTKKHMDGIREHGPTINHRMTFAPMKNMKLTNPI